MKNLLLVPAVALGLALAGCAQAQPVGQYLWQRPQPTRPLSGSELVACNQGATPQTATTVQCTSQDFANLALATLNASLGNLQDPINIVLPSTSPAALTITNSDGGNTTPFLSALQQAVGSSSNRLNVAYGAGISFSGTGGPTNTFGAMFYKCAGPGFALCLANANSDGTSNEPQTQPTSPTGALRVNFLNAFAPASSGSPALVAGTNATGPAFIRITAGILSQLGTGNVTGDEGVITDAVSCTFGSPVTGGGSLTCPVYFDTNTGSWKAG
jgi:hypothetical protein